MKENNSDDIDQKILEEMARVFEQMGMPIDMKTLRAMFEQVRGQFEEMGFDLNRVEMGEVGVNENPEEFVKRMESVFNSSDGFGEFMKKMGVNIKVKKSEPEIKVNIDDQNQDLEDESIPEDDVYISENIMNVIIDISKFTEVNSENLELSLTGRGEVIQLLRTTQLRPFKAYILPRIAKGQPSWSLNNGILDITFELQ
jgi:antitoxin component of RelBE/YafQ-DinJ toxin-antitoxin module